MSPFRLASCSWVVLTCVSAFCSAQSFSDGAAARLSEAEVRRLSPIEHDAVGYGTDGEGVLYARGSSFKMSFDASGAGYYPRFSPCQTSAYRQALSPVSVTLGGRPLAFEPAAAAVRAQDRVSFERGAFVESYDLAPDMIEQRFEFDSLPARGELVVRIEPGDQLEARQVEQAIEFRHELGRIRYGEAVALDAAGRSSPTVTRWTGDAIEIRVPAAFVESARLPLVIDPVVAAFVVDNNPSGDDFLADCAYDESTGRWLVVYAQQFSAVDGDILYRVFDSAGTELTWGFIDISSTNWSDPACADLRGWHNFLIVAGVGPAGNQEIRGRALTAGPLALSSDYPISNNFWIGDKRHPAIGADPTDDPLEWACVAYEFVASPTETMVVILFMDGDGTGAGIGQQTVFGANQVNVRPSVSKSNGGYEWLVAWSRELSSSVAQIWAMRVAWDGALVDGPFQVTTQTFTGDRFPSVSSPIDGTLGRLRSIAYQRLFFTDNDIEIAVLDGSTKLSEYNLSYHEFGGTNPGNQVLPSIDCDGRHFLVSYSETAGASYGVFASDLYLCAGGLGLAESHTLVSNSAYDESRPGVTSKWSYGGPKQEYMLVWDVQPTGGSGHGDVYGAFFHGDFGGNVSPFCGNSSGACPCGNGGVPSFGCPNSANTNGAALSVPGTPSTANDACALHATGLPPNASCLFFQGVSTMTSAPFGDGLRCIASPILRFPLRQASASGIVSYPSAGDPKISVLCGVPLTGGTRYYQAWYRDSASFCTSATYNLTNGVQIDWAP